MTSRSVSANASQVPRLRVAPKASKTYGDLASDLASDYGLTPDPWQRLILDDWLATTGGRWAALKCGLSVPRQNGKNGALEVRELFGMIGRGEAILHTAHQVKTAQKHFRRLKHFFGKKVDDPTAKFPELNALVSELRNVNGQEAIYLKNGGSVEIVARSQGSGRGFTVDVIVCDEAQDMSDDDLEALLSTSSAGALGDPQWIFTGTPPGPKANGAVFTRTRSDALDSKAKKVCWHEWAAEPGDDLDSRDVWEKANPGLVSGRLLIDVIEGERSTFSDDGFARERLGMWSGSLSQSVIDAQTWAKCADMTGQIDSEITIAVDVMPDRTAGSVSLAGLRPDERWQVELVDNRNSVGWIVDRVAGICGRQNVRAVVIDAMSPAASLIEPLKSKGVTVTVTNSRDMASACGQFYDAVMEDRLRHLDVPLLNSALGVARKRSLGDAWAWHRKNATADITPLVACTLALWGAQSESVARVKKPSAAFAF